MKIINKNLTIILLALASFIIILGFASALSSSSYTEFNMNFLKPYCDSTSNPIGWWDYQQGFYMFNGWNELNYNCYRADVEFGMNKCCPVGYNCNIQSGECEDGGPALCSDFKTETECKDNSNHQDIAENQLEEAGILNCNMEEYQYDSSSLCFENAECLCYWNQTSCIAISNRTVRKNTVYYSFPLPSNINDICNISADTPNPITGICEYDTDYIDNCNTTQQKVVSWTARWTGTNNKPESCVDGTRVVSCISGVLLNFFTNISLVIAILIIIAFYLIVRKRKKYYSKRKKR